MAAEIDTERLGRRLRETIEAIVREVLADTYGTDEPSGPEKEEVNTDPWAAGYAAWQEGKGAMDNPHDKGTPASGRWILGYEKARVDELTKRATTVARESAKKLKERKEGEA